MDVLDFDPSPSQGRCYFFIRQVVRRGCLHGRHLFLFVVPIKRLP